MPLLSVHSTLGARLASGLAAAAACLAAVPVQAQNAQFLVHEASGLCVDVAGAPGVNNGAAVRLWQCETQGNANGSQTDHKWYYQNGFVRNGLSNRCIDVPGAPGTASGLAVTLYDCELNGRNRNGSATDQQWDYQNGQFRNRLSGLCLGPETTDGYKNGHKLVLTACAKPGAADLEFSFRQPSGTPMAAALPAPAPAPKPAGTPAAQAKLLYPDVAGASQSCVVPVDPDTRRYSVKPLAKLALINCAPNQGKMWVVSRNRITVAGRPDLCVGAAAGARSADLYLETCAGVNVDSWDLAANATQSTPMRIAGGMFANQCVSIPELNNSSNPPMPYFIQLKDCGRNDLKFFLE
jgi:Ricin-type beta-trefoil lectin domain